MACDVPLITNLPEWFDGKAHCVVRRVCYLAATLPAGLCVHGVEGLRVC